MNSVFFNDLKVISTGLLLLVIHLLFGIYDVITVLVYSYGTTDLFGFVYLTEYYDERYATVFSWLYVVTVIGTVFVLYNYFTLNVKFKSYLITLAWVIAGITLFEALFLFSTPLYRTSFLNDSVPFWSTFFGMIFDTVLLSGVALFWTCYFNNNKKLSKVFN